ncbi:MAG: MBL fold metallo-hydrolase [Thermodesulfobacteriota bacterium]|nr:MBL fold metallo-hydrolase [Thermodesulfobacteriota bacterium]
MELTILGSGGCMVIPRPLCTCPVCRQAREKGIPYARSGPAAFLHDAGLLIDTPAEIAGQLNREAIGRVDHLIFTHLDPDHVEGFRVVEQIALDFRTWRACSGKCIDLVLPRPLMERLDRIRTAYGSQAAFYRDQGLIRCRAFDRSTRIGDVTVTALPVDRGDQTAYVYIFEKAGAKIVYAVCDIRPFPENDPVVRNPDLLVIQPGLFETGLKKGFVYPPDHVSRSTLYTFDQTVGLCRRIGAGKAVFVHLEEYWNRSHDDYTALEAGLDNMRFAHDGMRLSV